MLTTIPFPWVFSLANCAANILLVILSCFLLGFLTSRLVSQSWKETPHIISEEQDLPKWQPHLDPTKTVLRPAAIGRPFCFVAPWVRWRETPRCALASVLRYVLLPTSKPEWTSLLSSRHRLLTARFLNHWLLQLWVEGQKSHSQNDRHLFFISASPLFMIQRDDNDDVEQFRNKVKEIMKKYIGGELQ